MGYHVADEAGGLLWPPLTCGRLIKRYKRFLADVTLDSGETVTAHCANSGAMRTCAEPGMRVWLSFHDNPKRKLRYTWEMIEMPGSLVGVNTQVPNLLVAEAIRHECVPLFSGYARVKPEATVSSGSRLDLMLTADARRTCYVEIKNCTLVEDRLARFPDAVTTRGQKHLAELMTLVKSGYRCAMFFLIQRMDAAGFRPADDIDPAYGDALRKAVAAGVEICVYDVFMDETGIRLRQEIPLILR